MKVLKQNKRALLALLFFLTSCNSCPQWDLFEIDTGKPCFNSGRLFLPPAATPCTLELELDRTVSGLRMYINVFSLEISPASEDNLAQVKAVTENDVYCFDAIILQGGQRLLLPDEARDYIIEVLSSGELLTLNVGRYSADIISHKFLILMDQLVALTTTD